MSTPLLVNEVFRTLQGEGRFTGTPAVFVRLQGCDVGCTFCDTGYALNAAPSLQAPDNDELVFLKEDASPRYSAWEPGLLAVRVAGLAQEVTHVVVTGGEPFAQDLGPFLGLLKARGLFVQVETSGTRAMPKDHGRMPSWVTLSPKRARLPLAENWALANEVKVPIETGDDADFFEALLLETYRDALPAGTAPEIRLQPVSRKAEATRLCIELCMKRNWRLSLQTHKYLDLR